MRRGPVVLSVAAALAAPLLAGCGGPDTSIRPRQHFDVPEGWTRVYSKLDQDNPMPGSTEGAAIIRTVVVQAPKDTVAVDISLYCINRTGQVDANVDGAGGTSVKCSTRGTSGRATMEPVGLVAPSGRLRLTITIPARAKWSAAVDAGSHDLP